eukprot:IDg22774t1
MVAFAALIWRRREAGGAWGAVPATRAPVRSESVRSASMGGQAASLSRKDSNSNALHGGTPARPLSSLARDSPRRAADVMRRAASAARHRGDETRGCGNQAPLSIGSARVARQFWDTLSGSRAIAACRARSRARQGGRYALQVQRSTVRYCVAPGRTPQPSACVGWRSGLLRSVEARRVRRDVHVKKRASHVLRRADMLLRTVARVVAEWLASRSRMPQATPLRAHAVPARASADARGCYALRAPIARRRSIELRARMPISARFVFAP